MDLDKIRWKSEVSHPNFIAQYRFVKAKRLCEYWADKISCCTYLLGCDMNTIR